ncbi:hypothetical protein QYF61_012980 [Mycteria americana]|uniref:Uncharacterized protein n=1 Tax=Mycteria americana TaxID=33587 RepID=A0AAN7NQ16_MYCAM|nr:hypothetical protein QYF61_012980 [Mycteria americana]
MKSHAQEGITPCNSAGWRQPGWGAALLARTSRSCEAQAARQPAVCPGSEDSQQHPGLNEEERSQEKEGSDRPLSLALVRPHVRCQVHPVQGSRGCTGASSGEATRMVELEHEPWEERLKEPAQPEQGQLRGPTAACQGLGVWRRRSQRRDNTRQWSGRPGGCAVPTLGGFWDQSG